MNKGKFIYSIGIDPHFDAFKKIISNHLNGLSENIEYKFSMTEKYESTFAPEMVVEVSVDGRKFHKCTFPYSTIDSLKRAYSDLDLSPYGEDFYENVISLAEAGLECAKERRKEENYE